MHSGRGESQNSQARESVCCASEAHSSQVPRLNDDFSHEQGDRPAKPCCQLQLFRSLHALRAVNSESVQDIDEKAEEHEGRRHNITTDHSFLMLLNAAPP